MTQSTATTVSIWWFDGRSSRTDYFVVLLVTSVLGAIAGSLMFEGGALGVFAGLLCVAASWVSICAASRRFHDVGHSGWWSMVLLVPVVNLFLGLYLLFVPGQDEGNEFGPSALNSQSPRNSTIKPAPYEALVEAQSSAQAPIASNKEVIATLSVDSAPTTTDPMEEFWAQAFQECDSPERKTGLWAKAFSDAGGDERVAKATYVRLRTMQLHTQHSDREEALRKAREHELLVEQEVLKAQSAETLDALAKMTDVERAKALIPKGRCPGCAAVIPLSSTQCSECEALFGADSNWSIEPITLYAAIKQQSPNGYAPAASDASEEEFTETAWLSLGLACIVLLAVLPVLLVLLKR